MKVKITKWNAVATWRWDIPDDDVCGICQVHFDGTCPTCKYPGDDCSLRKLWPIGIRPSSNNWCAVSGKCGHNFHMVRTIRTVVGQCSNPTLALYRRVDQAGILQRTMPYV